MDFCFCAGRDGQTSSDAAWQGCREATATLVRQDKHIACADASFENASMRNLVSIPFCDALMGPQWTAASATSQLRMCVRGHTCVRIVNRLCPVLNAPFGHRAGGGLVRYLYNSGYTPRDHCQVLLVPKRCTVHDRRVAACATVPGLVADTRVEQFRVRAGVWGVCRVESSRPARFAPSHSMGWHCEAEHRRSETRCDAPETRSDAPNIQARAYSACTTLAPGTPPCMGRDRHLAQRQHRIQAAERAWQSLVRFAGTKREARRARWRHLCTGLRACRL